MIIWLNGAFGAGKTTVAECLHEELRSSWIYDPEEIGDVFRKILPPELQKDDFQKYPEWRAWNVHMLAKIYHSFKGDIIVPMSLYQANCFQEIFESLQQMQIPTQHFLLNVSRKELIRRLSQRNATLESWGISHLNEEFEFFESIPESEKIDNEFQTVEEVVQQIEKLRKKL